MKKIIINEDIKKEITARVLRRIFTFLGIIAAGAVLFFLFIHFFGKENLNVGNVTVISVGVLLLALYASGIPLKLIDSSWHGKIIKIENQSGDILHNLKKRKRIGMEFSRFALVRDEDGKLHYIEIFDEGHIYPNRPKYYNIGDTVVHIYGTEYLSPIHADPEKPQTCVICGFKTEGGIGKCCHCDSDLEIRIED